MGRSNVLIELLLRLELGAARGAPEAGGPMLRSRVLVELLLRLELRSAKLDK